jgi:hypothetical protein
MEDVESTAATTAGQTAATTSSSTAAGTNATNGLPGEHSTTGHNENGRADR